MIYDFGKVTELENSGKSSFNVRNDKVKLIDNSIRKHDSFVSLVFHFFKEKNLIVLLVEEGNSFNRKRLRIK